MRTGDSLAKIQVPALILKADAPLDTRKTHQEIASVMLRGRLVHIDGGGHNLHHDEPETTLEAINEFLSTL
jgi:pimeloyl-ACP methyl ester carboxylesterase